MKLYKHKKYQNDMLKNAQNFKLFDIFRLPKISPKEKTPTGSVDWLICPNVCRNEKL